MQLAPITQLLEAVEDEAAQCLLVVRGEDQVVNLLHRIHPLAVLLKGVDAVADSHQAQTQLLRAEQRQELASVVTLKTT